MAVDPDQRLWQEHHALLAQYARVQSRCSDLIEAQRERIVRLEAEAIRLRARAIVRDSEFAWVFQPSWEAADLVICQTGCVSHDDYWRVHDHCLRTGKTCVLVARPHALEERRPAEAAQKRRPAEAAPKRRPAEAGQGQPSRREEEEH